MKFSFHYLAILALTLVFVPGCAQDAEPRTAYLEFWNKTDSEFRNPETSPLSENEIARFDSVSRYEYDEKFRVEAHWEPVRRQKPITFETTGQIKQRYQKAGVLHFEIDTVELELTAYRNLELMRKPEYQNRLFVPFTDASNGETTYEGGRYLELQVPENDRAVLDFNLAYNPYCVYSHRYSCPIPPRENNLKVPIEAGAKVDE